MTTRGGGTVAPSSDDDDNDDRQRHYAQYKLFVDVYVICSMCVIGFIGNVLSFGVLCSNRHERRGTTTCLLQTLAVVDTAYLCTCLIIQPIKVSPTCLRLSYLSQRCDSRGPKLPPPWAGSLALSLAVDRTSGNDSLQ